ncbi:MAG: tyrosine-type recombinase/integrase [Deltaproteobacteria bacterium]|nr:tyrosine-type recombinase/integrase [Candidatus Zymogenaceae bacterium]
MKNPIPAFITHLKNQGKRPGTWRLYGKILMRLQEHKNTWGPVTGRTTAQIEDFLSSIGGTGKWRKVNTIAVKNFYRWLHERGAIPNDPTAEIGTPKVPEREYLPPTEAEVARIRAAAGPRIAALLFHLEHTGLRISEALGTRREDVLLDRVENGKLRPALLVEGKGGNRIHLPLLNAQHVEWLRRRLRHMEPGDRLFRFTYSTAWYGIHHAAVRAGVQRVVYDDENRNQYHISPHSLRRFFAKRLVDRGVPINTVQYLMRHRSVETTAKYARASEGDAWRQMEAVNG